MSTTPSLPFNIRCTDSERPSNFLTSLISILRSVPSGFLRVIHILLPNSLHVTLLRLVLQLPGLYENSPELAEQIARYVVNERKPITPSLPQASGRLAASAGLRTSMVQVSRSTTDCNVPLPLGFMSPTQVSSHAVLSVDRRSEPGEEFPTPSSIESFHSELILVPMDDPVEPLTDEQTLTLVSSPLSAINWGGVRTPIGNLHAPIATSPTTPTAPRRSSRLSPHILQPTPHAPSIQASILDANPSIHGSPAPSYQEALLRDTLSTPFLSNSGTTFGSSEPAPPQYPRSPMDRPRRGLVDTGDQLVGVDGLRLDRNTENAALVALPHSPSEVPPRRNRNRPPPLRLTTDPPFRTEIISEAPRQPEEPQLPPVDLPCSEATTPEGFRCNVLPPTRPLTVHLRADREPIPSPKSPIHETFSRVLEHNGIEYHIQSMIGEGGFGRVFAAKTVDNRWFAIKIICKYKQFKIFQGASEIKLEKHIMLLADVRNMPFVNKLCASWVDKFHAYLVMPLCSKNMVAYIQTLPDPCLDYESFGGKVLQASKELITAMDQVNEQGYMHRDIKPSNILVDKHGHLLLSDFGLVCKFSTPKRSAVGTIYYMAPEVIEHKYYDSACDIWSLGLVLFEMHTKMTRPYFMREYARTEEEIISLILNEPIDFERILNPVARDLIRNMLVHDPIKRYTLADIKEHHYFGFDRKQWSKFRKEAKKNADLLYDTPTSLPQFKSGTIGCLQTDCEGLSIEGIRRIEKSLEEDKRTNFYNYHSARLSVSPSSDRFPERDHE